MRDKENEKKKQEIEKAKAEINETMIQNQLDSYLDSIVSKIVDNEYLKRLNIEIETLRSDLLN
ncbi:MAG: hypothetical protein QM532_01590 [Cyanobium sp. MAG06]|nr:hypothetical protein [Cyanobium sp. MAG06]